MGNTIMEKEKDRNRSKKMSAGGTPHVNRGKNIKYHDTCGFCFHKWELSFSCEGEFWPPNWLLPEHRKPLKQHIWTTAWWISWGLMGRWNSSLSTPMVPIVRNYNREKATNFKGYLEKLRSIPTVNPDPDPTLLFNFGQRSRTVSGFGSSILHKG